MLRQVLTAHLFSNVNNQYHLIVSNFKELVFQTTYELEDVTFDLTGQLSVPRYYVEVSMQYTDS